MQNHFSPFRFWLLLGVGSLIFFSACREGTVTEDIDIDFGYDYYPLSLGKYWVYEVDSVVFDYDGNLHYVDTSILQVREVLVDTFRDIEGDLNYKIERSERFDPLAAWEVKDIWYTKATDRLVERNEENFRIISLVFPIQEDIAWEATQHIDNNTLISIRGESIEAFKNWASEIVAFGQDTITSFEFQDIVTVTHANDENLIEKRYVEEHYASGVGLIYKSHYILDAQDIENSELPFEERESIGYILTQKLIDYN